MATTTTFTVRLYFLSVVLLCSQDYSTKSPFDSNLKKYFSLKVFLKKKNNKVFDKFWEIFLKI